MKIIAIVIVCFCFSWAASVFSDTPPQQNTIKFTAGVEFFQDGDSITISEVKATSPDPKTGDKVTVKGRYSLSSKPNATLSLFATDTKGSDKQETQSEQKKEITMGKGEFELSITLIYDGYLHVTFYSVSDGNPFGGIYFGSAKQMEEIKDWKLHDWYTAK